MADWERELLQKGETFAGRESLMQERRQAQVAAQQAQQQPQPAPTPLRSEAPEQE